jgi:non-ribosomal peptide synthetase component F
MKVLLTHRGLEQKLPVRPPAVVHLDSDWNEIAKQSAAATDLPSVSQNNLAYVLYTSGSTGKPKGVEIPHSAIINFLLSMQRKPGFSAGDTLLAVTTLSFDIAGLELYLPLICGGKVVIASHEDTRDPARLAKRIADSACNVMQATPTTWRFGQSQSALRWRSPTPRPGAGTSSPMRRAVEHVWADRNYRLVNHP